MAMSSFYSSKLQVAATFFLVQHIHVYCTIANAQDISVYKTEQDILRQPLIDLGAGLDSADRDITAFQDNKTFYGSGPGWHVRTPARDGQNFCISLIIKWQSQLVDLNNAKTNDAIGIASETDITSSETPRASTYDVVYKLFNTIQKSRGYCLNVPNFAITASYVIPKCSYNFPTAETCYPRAKIFVPSTYLGGFFFIRTVLLPTAPTSVSLPQPNRATQTISQGQWLTFDRSEGDTTISLNELQADSFAPIIISEAFNEGPVVNSQPPTTHVGRFTTYHTLANIRTAIHWAEVAPPAQDQALNLKTLHTELRMVSAYAIHAGYDKVVRELLTSRAQDLASDDQQVLALRNLVVSSNTITPGDVDLTITRVDQMLLDPTITNRDTLTTIKQELLRARDAIVTGGGVVTLLRDNMISEIDRQIADYQSLVLEYAQFVDDKTLSSVIPEGQKAKILSGLSRVDVRITNDTLGGRGSAIRLAAGLPAP